MYTFQLYPDADYERNGHKNTIEIERLAFENVLKKKSYRKIAVEVERSFSYFSLQKYIDRKMANTATVRAMRDVYLGIDNHVIAITEIARFCTLWTNVNDELSPPILNIWDGERASTRCPKLVADVSFIMLPAIMPSGHNGIVRVSHPRTSTYILGKNNSKPSVLHAANRSSKSQGPCVGEPPRENFNV